MAAAWRRAGLLAFMVGAGAAGGCTPTVPARGPLTPRSELLGVRIFLDPNVEFTTTDRACDDLQRPFSTEAVNGAGVGLARVGFDVGRDPAAPRDASARVSLTVTNCQKAARTFGGTMPITLTPGAPAAVAWEVPAP